MVEGISSLMTSNVSLMLYPSLCNSDPPVVKDTHHSNQFIVTMTFPTPIYMQIITYHIIKLYYSKHNIFQIKYYLC